MQQHVGWGAGHGQYTAPPQAKCPRCGVEFQLVYARDMHNVPTKELVLPKHRRTFKPGESSHVKDLPLCE